VAEVGVCNAFEVAVFGVIVELLSYVMTETAVE
jgi:hypothetical protein